MVILYWGIKKKFKKLKMHMLPMKRFQKQIRQVFQL